MANYFLQDFFANADVCQSAVQQVKTQQTVYSYGAYMGFRIIEFTKTKGQLKRDAQQKKLAEKEAAKKLNEEKKKAAAEKKRPSGKAGKK